MTAARIAREVVPQGPEQPLVDQPQLQAWAGFRVGIFAAQTYSSALRTEGPSPQLALILKGRTRASIDSRGQRHDFSPAPDVAGLFAPCLDISACTWQCSPGAERLLIELDFGDMAWADGSCADLLPDPKLLRQDLQLRDAQLTSLMRVIASEVRQGSPHGRLYATSLSIALASHLAHRCSARPPSRERGGLTPAQCARVEAYVREHMATEITLEDLAHVVGINRFQFVRLFKNSFGTTPYQYVIDQRVKLAHRLLLHTSDTIADIAYSAGFSSQSHLTTTMRRATGTSPGHLRARGH